MDAIFINGGGHFDNEPIRQVLDEAVVGDVDRFFDIASIGEDALDDRDDALFEAQLDVGLGVGQVFFVEAVKIEDAFVVSHIVSPGDVLAKVAVAGYGHEAKFLENDLEDTPLGPGFGRNRRQFFKRLRPLAGLFEVLVHRIHRGHVPKELGRFGADIGIGVFAGVDIFGGEHTAKVVQPASAHFQLLVGDAQDLGQEIAQRSDLMAHADELEVREGAGDGGADAAHRVAEIEDGRLGANFHHVGADIEDGRDDAQRVEQPAGAAILAVHLAHAVLLGDTPILLPKLKAVADLDRADQEICALEGLGAVGGGREGKGQLVLGDECFGGFGNYRQRVGVDVVQHDVAAFEDLALQDVADGAVAELGAACSD